MITIRKYVIPFVLGLLLGVGLTNIGSQKLRNSRLRDICTYGYVNGRLDQLMGLEPELGHEKVCNERYGR